MSHLQRAGLLDIPKATQHLHVALAHVVHIRLGGRATPSRPRTVGAAGAGVLRIAAGACFLLGMLEATDEIARGRLLELVEDDLAWGMVLALFALLPWHEGQDSGASRRASRAAFTA